MSVLAMSVGACARCRRPARRRPGSRRPRTAGSGRRAGPRSRVRPGSRTAAARRDGVPACTGRGRSRRPGCRRRRPARRAGRRPRRSQPPGRRPSRAVRNRSLASRIRSRSAGAIRSAASRTASWCIAATTSRASRTASASTSLTTVDRPGRATTSPASPMRRSASRTGVRLTPSHCRQLLVAELLAGGEGAVHDRVAEPGEDVVPEQGAGQRGSVLRNGHAIYCTRRRKRQGPAADSR